MRGRDDVIDRSVVVSGTAHPDLARAIAAAGRFETVAADIERFPDGELHVAVDERVAGAHVHLVQPTGAPADRHLLELLLLVDACRRAGARTVTAVVPYFGYARQDRRTSPGEAVGLRVVADMLGGARVDRIVTVDPHAPTLEAVVTVPVTLVTAVPPLARALASALPADPVLVAPDLGAVKLAERYAAVLDLPVAVVRKARLSATEVRADQVVGAVAGRTPVIVDDMISTGATIAAAAAVLARAGARERMVIAATHGVFSGAVVDALDRLSVDRLLVTDTLPDVRRRLPAADVISVAGLLAGALHEPARFSPGADLPPGVASGLQRHLR
ncbi:MAG TPA: ribose-phosphate diphosphokinase [Euzebyales bacterium]